MKQLILLIMLIAILLLVSEIGQATIQLVIVIPSELVPYFDWWLGFPGWQQIHKQTPTHKIPTKLLIEFQPCFQYARIGGKITF
jgi:hypothetical protein